MKIIKKSYINLASVIVIILAFFLLSNCTVFAEKNISAVSYYERFFEYAESKSAQTNLYKLNNANLLNENGESQINVVSGLYSGHESSKYNGFIVIDYNYGTYLVEKSQAIIVDGAKVLSTAVVSQIDGKYKGYSACGPTAAAILLNSEKNENLSKDDLIKYAKKHNLSDQGSLTSHIGGMTSPNVIKLIKAYGYNVSNIYNSSVNPSHIIKNQIDSGKRVIALVRYNGSINQSEGVAHFVVVCGYRHTNGKLCFYYADSYYSSGEGRSLMKVSANTLDASVSGTFSEPNTILVLE